MDDNIFFQKPQMARRMIESKILRKFARLLFAAAKKERDPIMHECLEWAACEASRQECIAELKFEKMEEWSDRIAKTNLLNLILDKPDEANGADEADGRE